MAWLSVDLLRTAGNPLGRLLLWVVLLLDDHTKPARCREMRGMVPDVSKTRTKNKMSDWLYLPEIALEVVLKVC